jgi:hypothetical protein
MDCQHSGKAIGARFFCGLLEAYVVSKIGVERVDRHHAAGMRGQQRLGAGIAESIGPVPLFITLTGGAERG